MKDSIGFILVKWTIAIVLTAAIAIPVFHFTNLYVFDFLDNMFATQTPVPTIIHYPTSTPTSTPSPTPTPTSTPAAIPTETLQPTPTPELTAQQSSAEEEELKKVSMRAFMYSLDSDLVYIYVFTTPDNSYRLVSSEQKGNNLDRLHIVNLSKEELEELDEIPFWNYEHKDVLTYDQYKRIRDIQRFVYVKHDIYLFGRVVRGDDVDVNTEFEFNENEILAEYAKSNSYLVFFIEPDSDEMLLILGGICEEDLEIYNNGLSGMLEYWANEVYEPNNIEALIDFFLQIQLYLDLQHNLNI